MFFLSRNQIDRVKGRLLESPLGKKENKTGEMFLDIHDFYVYHFGIHSVLPFCHAFISACMICRVFSKVQSHSSISYPLLWCIE